MSSFSETIALQSHISERSMDWHDTMARYRRVFEDAILKQDPSCFHDNLTDSSLAADWFLSISEDSALIAKFHIASMVSFCADLAVAQGLPRALAHSIKDDCFYSLAHSSHPDGLIFLTEKYVARLITELQDHCHHQYSHLVLMATTFIYQNLYQNIHPRDVAAYLKKDRTYVAKKFHEETGMTLTNYIRKAKVTRARYLISQHVYSLAEISEMLGYPNYAQFHRHFHRETGCAPTEFPE